MTHTLVQSKQHSPDSVWQTGRGRRMTMNHWCSAHRSQTKHASMHAHQMHAHTNTHTQAHAHIYLLSLTHPSFPIYSVVFFSVPSLILWWQRQMEGLRGERLTNRGGEISRCLLLWSEITLIATVGLYFSGFAIPFVIFFATSFMSFSLYFPSEPGISY